MRLYCDCGNEFNSHKDRWAKIDHKCPLCGRMANESPTEKFLHRGRGGTPVEAKGMYHYRNADGMGGKIPRRWSQN